MSKFRPCPQLALSICFTLFSAASAQAENLWDNWYIVSEKGNPDSYYNEKAEIVGEKAKIQVNTWIKDGDRIKVENLGATAKNTASLEPLLYNFRSQGNDGDPTTLKTIDGSIINNGKVFSVKIKRAGKESKPIRAEMLPKLILASFFPVWIHNNYKRITGVQPTEFHAIVEDQVEDQVPVVKGDAYEMLPDEFSKKSGTRKIRVVFNNIVNFWYVTKKGDAVKVTIPSLNKVIEKSDKETAQKYLTPAKETK